MKGKTKAVGGSPVSAGAIDFTNFLTQGLKGGSFTPSNQQQAFGQTMGMGGAIDKLLSGNVGDPMSLTEYFKNGNTGFANINPTTSNFQLPNFQGLNLNAPGAITAPQAGPVDFNSALSSITGASGFNPNDFMKVMQDELERNVRTQNAGMSGSGTGFMSSGKVLGESLLRSQAVPQMGLALSQIRSGQTDQALNLAGMKQGTDIANIQAALAALSQNQNTELGFNNQLLNQNQFQNQFNQSNAQFAGNLDLQSQIANIQNQLQNQAQGNTYGLNLGQLFQGFQGNQIGAQQNMLGMLFNAFNQLNALGTPQAQMVQEKSPFEQITGGIGGILGMASPFFSGGFQNPFGSGMPDLGTMPGVGTTPNYGGFGATGTPWMGQVRPRS